MSDARDAVEATLHLLVMGGFENAAGALAALELVIEDPDAAWRARLRARAAELEQDQRAREAGWSTRTVNDRIDAAFAELQERGLVALQNAGYTLSEGWEDAAAEARPGTRGAVFYHQQDAERALQGGGLMLAFGAFDSDDPGKTVQIGHEIREVLRLNDLAVEWNEHVDTRLSIPPFAWQKRRFTKRGGVDLVVIACLMEQRIAVIKACRQVLGIDIKTAKAGLDALQPPDVVGRHLGPPWRVLRGIPRADATRFAAALQATGAKAEVR